VDAVSYENGRPTDRDVYDDYGFLLGREHYQYGETDLLSQSVLRDARGKKIELKTYSYNSKGEKILIRTYDAHGRLKVTQNYTYDIKRNLVVEAIRDSSRVIEKKISKLDPNGGTKEVSYYDSRGNLTEKWSFTYDAVGNLREETLYNPDGSRQKRFVHTYELDAHGNWIMRKTTVRLNSPGETLYESTFVTYRMINYH